MSNQDHPFLRPLWRRIVLVAFCFGWAALEFATNQPLWGMLFGAMGVYGFWIYLWTYGKPDA